MFLKTREKSKYYIKKSDISYFKARVCDYRSDSVMVFIPQEY